MGQAAKVQTVCKMLLWKLIATTTRQFYLILPMITHATIKELLAMILMILSKMLVVRRKAQKKPNRKRLGKKVRDVISECAFKYQKQVEDAKKAGKVVPHGTLKEIIKEEEGKMA
jgi:hypothetical protein